MSQNLVRHNSLKRFPRPPHSLDVFPSGFSLFMKVKTALIGREIPGEINLLEAVTGILNSLSDAELQRVFRSWINMLKG
jgi:hypothetical protein